MKPNNFLFITHLTPQVKRSAIRQKLIDAMELSLHSQTYQNWRAIHIGETDRVRGKITEINVERIAISEYYSTQEFMDILDWADYIIKLDDDDIILPNTLEAYSHSEWDCIFDDEHVFYDIVTNRFSRQKRDWIPATCLHKKSCAIQPLSGSGNFINSLFYGNHAKDWIQFYKTRRVHRTGMGNPLYVRILSPTSITAQMSGVMDDQISAYCNYLSQFGNWSSVAFLTTSERRFYQEANLMSDETIERYGIGLDRAIRAQSSGKIYRWVRRLFRK